jgi:hypothetical protein
MAVGAATLVLSSCGGGSGKGAAVSGAKAAAKTSPAIGTTSTSGLAATAAGSTKTSAPASGGTPSSVPAPAGTGSATADPATLSPATPGTYHYRQSGTTTEGAKSSDVPAEGRLVVAGAGADHSQVMTRYVRDSDPPEETTFVFRDGGVFLRRFVVKTGLGGASFDFACDFAPEVPAPPWPAKAGATISASGNCGTFTAKVTGKISGAEETQLDGKALKVWVVELTLDLSGQVTGTVHEVDRFAPALSLSVRSNRDMDIQYGFSRYKTSVASVLESGHPT